MLRVLEFQGKWEDDFSYNNSYYSIIKLAPFKGIYGRKLLGFVPNFFADFGNNKIVSF